MQDPWNHAKELFEKVIELPEDARERFLEHACGADEALRRAVESLLAAYDVEPPIAEPAREHPASPGLSQPPRPGVKTDAYRPGPHAQVPPAWTTREEQSFKSHDSHAAGTARRATFARQRRGLPGGVR